VRHKFGLILRLPFFRILSREHPFRFDSLNLDFPLGAQSRGRPSHAKCEIAQTDLQNPLVRPTSFFHYFSDFRPAQESSPIMGSPCVLRHPPFPFAKDLSSSPKRSPPFGHPLTNSQLIGDLDSNRSLRKTLH